MSFEFNFDIFVYLLLNKRVHSHNSPFKLYNLTHDIFFKSNNTRAIILLGQYYDGGYTENPEPWIMYTARGSRRSMS